MACVIDLLYRILDFVFISKIPGEDDYDVRRTIFISSAWLMGVMKLSVMSDPGQIRANIASSHISNVLLTLPRDTRTRGLLYN